MAAAAPGMLALVLGLLATLSDGTTPAVAGADWPRPVLLAVALLIASTGVGAARPAIGHLVPVLPPFCALVTTPLTVMSGAKVIVGGLLNLTESKYISKLVLPFGLSPVEFELSAQTANPLPP